MTSTSDLDGPNGTARTSRRRPWLVGLVAVAAAAVTTLATATAYVVTHAGNRSPAPGALTVDVHAVDESISTVVDPADRPGVLGRFFGMCDADTYYLEVDGTGSCLVLSGSLGRVRVTSTGHGVELDAAQAATVRDLVRRAESDGSTRASRLLLEYDGGWAGLVDVAELSAGGPVTGRAVG
ncbi:hypothetical protein K7640_02475 [Micromonospora sp. PLK6-60]|uniref:hypothetical protein n=1 Tax=Micromonospora sp. PLK6-60 TaxID=2873383 RepID=UPI001CA6349F|nr:hypothetical protein [Micromonospora sp. PLK6-60]MBY8870706.1 hypothetical protein [Micromonospora sp. PLK6-60]